MSPLKRVRKTQIRPNGVCVACGHEIPVSVNYAPFCSQSHELGPIIRWLSFRCLSPEDPRQGLTSFKCSFPNLCTWVYNLSLVCPLPFSRHGTGENGRLTGGLTLPSGCRYLPVLINKTVINWDRLSTWLIVGKSDQGMRCCKCNSNSFTTDSHYLLTQ